nr:hypothetical protein [uncultured bacterium]
MNAIKSYLMQNLLLKPLLAGYLIYRKEKNREFFLSIIRLEYCNFNSHVGFYLNTDHDLKKN